MFKNNTYRSNTVFHTLLLVFGLLFATSLIVARQPVPTATAAPSTYLNFQARLKTSSGSVVPDGFYNIEFKLYGASSGGSALWTETRTGANVVRVANGYFTVSLGSVTAFPGNIDWSQQHWITMNIGGTGSPTWDGEMNPRLLLTAVPHAFHADRASALSDGTNDYTHNDFIKIAPGALQGTTSTASAVRINQTGSGGLLQLQSAGSDVFTISNSGQTTVRNTSSSAFRVQNGAGTTSTLLVDTTNNRVGIGTDSIGSGIDLQVGNSSGNVHVALAPANNGTSIIDFDGGSGANNIVYEDADGRISMRANGGALQVNYEGVRINRNLYIGTESGTDTLLVLDNKTTSGDVAGATNGAMYYNVDAGKFRCYEGGVWKDCISTSNIGDITQGGNSFGATMAIGTNDEEDLVLKTNGSSRLTIGSDGVATFSGSVVAGSFTGSGSLLTNLDASNISTGTLAIARGGTGATTAQGAMNVLSGLTTQGDLLYHNGTNSTRLARGTNGQCLTSDATTILWGSCGITSIGTFSTVNTSATGATLSGSQIVFQAASATAPGMVSTGNQTFAGSKSFNDTVSFNGGTFGISLIVDRVSMHNGGIIMGSSTDGVLLSLGHKTTSGDPGAPSSNNGAMYYNTIDGKFRCYEGGAWKDCISTSNIGDITQGGNDLGGSTAMTIGTTNNGGLNLMTNNQTRIAIASNGTISASGNLLPSTNDTYSLGSDTSRWADLYVGSSTLHIGESLSDEGTISYDAANSNLVLGATNGVNVRSASNSTTAFQIQNAIGTALLKADTTNSLVEVGNDGNVAIEGGDIWTARTAAEANSWQSVTYGNGIFVAVAYSGTNRVMTSPDGITWTARTAAEANAWVSVTYGNGLFVAVSIDGTNRVMTSPDGITWTARTAAEDNNWQSITYGNGLFVAVAGGGTNRVMTSPDGITWTARTAAEANNWQSVTYGNGIFVAVAYSGTNQVMTSPDGITWTARTAAEASWWYSVTYGNGLFVAVAGGGTNQVMTSPDGITWTARTAAEANWWYSVTYGNGLFVAVADSGTNQVMTSPDGITWTARTAAEANAWVSVTYGNGLFVAVSIDGTNQVMTSPVSTSYTTALRVTGGSEFTGSLLVGDSSNGILLVAGRPIEFLGSSRPVKRITLSPEYMGATISPDGVNNLGNMTSDFCSGSSRRNINSGLCGANEEHSYYSWTTTEGSAQDYDIYVRYQIPSDFDGFVSNSTLGMYGWRSASGESVELAMFQADGTQCGSTTSAATGNNAWTFTQLNGDEAACSVSPGDVVVFRVKMTATSGNYARAGDITFQYFAKF